MRGLDCANAVHYHGGTTRHRLPDSAGAAVGRFAAVPTQLDKVAQLPTRASGRVGGRHPVWVEHCCAARIGIDFTTSP